MRGEVRVCCARPSGEARINHERVQAEASDSVDEVSTSEEEALQVQKGYAVKSQLQEMWETIHNEIPDRLLLS